MSLPIYYRDQKNRIFYQQQVKQKSHVHKAIARAIQRHTRKTYICLLPFALGFFPLTATAQPIIPDSTTSTNVTQQGNNFNISGGQLSNNGTNLFHGFSQFGVNSNQTANFLSNPSIQNILGRITSGNPSIINGLIQVVGGNSNLFLMNPAGIVFGPNASLNVPAAFTATTATSIGIGNSWFHAIGDNDYGQLVDTPNRFVFGTSQTPGAIINQGQLVVRQGQNLTLIGGIVTSTGTLKASGGNISIAAVTGGNYLRISQSGHLLSLEIQPNNAQNAFLPDISPLSLPQLLTGSSQAGGVTISGTVDVSSPQMGGSLQVLGNKVEVLGANINASGNNGGGRVLIGGDYQGKGTTPNASFTYVDQGTIINANSNVNGNGGRVIVWADDTTHFFGKISVRGGIEGGDGGFVEVSGKSNLNYQGNVNALAPLGKVGTLLLDPTNIQIVAAANANTSNLNDVNNVAAPDLPGGTRLNVDVLNNATANIILQASNNITFDAPVNITNQGVGLTAQAGNNIIVNQGIITNGGNLNFLANDNTLGTATGTGSVLINAPINTTFNGDGGFLTGNFTSRGFNFNSTGGTITTNGGNININSDNLITTNLLNSGGNANSGVDGGSVILTAGGTIVANRIITSASSFGAPPTAISGAVALTSGSDITTGAINSDFSAFGGSSFGSEGGSILLDAVGDITTGAINSGSTNFSTFSRGATISRGGTVDLRGRNITFDSINTQGSANVNGITGIGGNVQVTARGVVRGTGAITNLTPAPTPTFPPIPNLTIPPGTTIFSRGTNQGGVVTIQHDGGPDNDSFIVGNLSSGNGLVGAINTNTGILSGGIFPVLATDGTAVGTPNGIIINSVNTAPTLIVNPQLSPLQVGQQLTFTFADLNVFVNDRNNDRTRDNTVVVIDAVTVGTLTKNGIPVVPGQTTVSQGDVLVYTPPTGVVGQISAFTLRANDRVSVSPARAIAINVTPIPTPTPNPTPTPTPIPTPTPTPTTSPSPIRNPLPEEKAPPRLQVNFELPAVQIDPIMGQLEEAFTQKFEQYFGQNTPTTIKSLDEGREILSQIEEATGVKPALIYVTFVPQSITKTTQPLEKPKPQANDQLELVVITAKGTPIRKRLSGAMRENVLNMAQEFRKQATNFRSRQGYLASSQQLYQWLVAPLESDLQAREINNLVFLMDTGLRSLPVAALHDGKGFLIERYSVGLMPSLSLADTRYKNIKDAKVLAMGSETFTDQKRLPAVPTEVATISGRLWQGKSFLNNDFTLENLKQARQQQPYGIIHLATHGEFQSGTPNNSYIQLWDTKLRLDQLRQLGWNNPPVELLVLSACRTAVGDEQAELGFAGLGVLAGVKSALASLWYVSDIGTLGVMTDFYEQLNSAPIKAEALRQTQLAMLKGQVHIEKGKLLTSKIEVSLPPELANLGNQKLDHPYYWAAFTMIGNPW